MPAGGEDVFQEHKWVEKRKDNDGFDLDRIAKACRVDFHVERGELLTIIRRTGRIDPESGDWLPEKTEVIGYYRGSSWESVRKD